MLVLRKVTGFEENNKTLKCGAWVLVSPLHCGGEKTQSLGISLSLMKIVPFSVRIKTLWI